MFVRPAPKPLLPREALELLRRYGLSANLSRDYHRIPDDAIDALGLSARDTCVSGGIYSRKSDIAQQVGRTSTPSSSIRAMKRGFEISWLPPDAWRVQMTCPIGNLPHIAQVDSLESAVWLVIDMFTGCVPLEPEDSRR